MRTIDLAELVRDMVSRDAPELYALYARHREEPAVRSKRDLWGRLLTTALGTGFVDSDELFVEHSLLVATAEVIAHAVIGLDPTAPEVSATSRVTGQLFAAVRVYGVVDADFFDWIVEVPGGERFLDVLARRLARFPWRDVEHDVLKVLYEGVISAPQRKKLGEYYTPDWLAERIVDAVVRDPLEQRVLDPACGSGTFLFHAIRRYLDAAREAGIDDASALSGVTEHVFGMDVHPVAVTFARVTYLLAIGSERLQARGRPSLSIPVHLGDGIPWGYHAGTAARPVWLTRPENRVDVLIGNPPWLSYRFMTRAMQTEFRRLSEECGLWAGAAVATNQDLSTLFVLRSMVRYLHAGGSFGFVMPWAVLRGRQHAGFRKGRYTLVRAKDLTVAFGRPWDLHAVKPPFFPVPSCVAFGRRAEKPVAISSAVEKWSGRLPQINVGWDKAKKYLSYAQGSVVEATEPTPSSGSLYDRRFAQGATILPRVLVVVHDLSSGPLGSGAGRASVMSRRSAHEKAPWKSVPPLEGSVERQFVRSTYLGEALLPYRTQKPSQAIVPWDGQRLLHGREPRLALYPGLEAWWREAERIWGERRSDEKLSLIGRLDFHKGLSQQFPSPTHRIIYNGSGMYLAAAVIEGDAVVEHQLYWGPASSLAEARYLEAVLNSEVVTQRLRPLQARGEHNPRHYDKLVWQLPIPLYDPNDERHGRLSTLAELAEQIAARVDLPAGKRFERQRGLVREAIAATDTGRQIEHDVAELLG
jgi:hypothetical protein